MNDETHQNRRWNVLTALSLAAIIAVAAYYRWEYLSESLWVDELHTSWVVASELDDVPARAALGNQSPLYFLATWFVVEAGGFSEFTLRLPSLICGMLLIPIGYWCVLRWTHSRIAGITTAVLIAIDPLLIFYSNEARPYAAVQLFGLLQVSALARAIENSRDGIRPQPALSAFVLLSIALFYLHYTAGLLFVAEGLVLIVIAIGLAIRSELGQRSFRQLGVGLFVSFSLIAMACLPAITQLSDIADRRGQWDAILVEWPNRDLLRILVTCVAAPTVVALIAATASLLLRPRAQRSFPRWQIILLVLGWTLLPAIAVTLLAEAKWAQLLLNRYIIVSAVGAMAWAGLSVGIVRAANLRFLAAACVLAFAIGLIWHEYRGQLQSRNEGWREAIAVINSSNIKGEPVLICSGLVEDENLRDSEDADFRNYCEFPVRGLYFIREATNDVYPLPSQTPDPLSDEHYQAVRDGGGAWLLVRGDPEQGEIIEEDILWSLREAGMPAVERSRHEFGLVTCFWIGIEAE